MWRSKAIFLSSNQMCRHEAGYCKPGNSSLIFKMTQYHGHICSSITYSQAPVGAASLVCCEGNCQEERQEKERKEPGRYGRKRTFQWFKLAMGFLLLAHPLICPPAIVWIQRKINHMDTQLFAASDEMHILKSLFYYSCKLRAQQKRVVVPSPTI